MPAHGARSRTGYSPWPARCCVIEPMGVTPLCGTCAEPLALSLHILAMLRSARQPYRRRCPPLPSSASEIVYWRDRNAVRVVLGGAFVLAARSFYRTPRGSRRTLIRFEPKTTTAPAMSSASTVLKLASRSRSKLAAPRSGTRRKRITEGLALFRRASSVPKSVSSDSKIRPSRTASSKRTVSSADCSPRSRTCRASWLPRGGPRPDAATAHCRRGASSSGQQR